MHEYEIPRTLPVIGLWQPYATLVAIGAKPWETRHFAPPPRLVGKRVAIQATLRKPTRDEVLTAFPPQIRDRLGAGWEKRVPYGAVVCTAILHDGRKVREWFQGYRGGRVTLDNGVSFADDGFGDYTIGRWCWALTDVLELNEPVPLMGRQTVGWDWEPDAAQRAALASGKRR